jgi:dipicolinate synthase subunit A
MTVDLHGRIVAVLGGDGREVEIVRQLVAAGATVRTCGLPAEGVEAARAPACATIVEAAAGAEVVICPIPIPDADGSIFSPAASGRLIVDANSLRGMRRGGVLITGRAGAQMREAAAVLGLRLREYEADEDLMLLRAPAVAEGAIRVAIEQTNVTLHHNPCLVVGFGKIGPVLARALLGLGARVWIAARNPVQLARAYALGCDTMPIQEIPERASEMAVIFNTAPVLLFTRIVLERMGAQTVLIDLSMPPGGVDFAAARELGRKVVWARGLGGRAPRTVGQSQWLGISRLLQAALEGQGEETQSIP